MTYQAESPAKPFIARLERRVGAQLGISSWLTVEQARINGFADITFDHQFIHVDPIGARDGPFGGTVAHGFLVLSLLSAMAAEAVPELGEASATVNYGFDRVRFISPVPSDARIRASFVLQSLARRAEDQVLLTFHTTVDVEGTEKPALIADWLVLAVA